jgi:hypothetical protein
VPKDLDQLAALGTHPVKAPARPLLAEG